MIIYKKKKQTRKATHTHTQFRNDDDDAADREEGARWNLYAHTHTNDLI